MGDLYFDVTEMVSYAKRHDTVTGIQRAQLNIILFLAAASKKREKVYCVFYNKKSQAYCQISPMRNRMKTIGSAENFLDSLKWVDKQDSPPKKHRIKKFLKKYKNNHFLRIFKKMDIYISLVLFPSRLVEFGLKKPHGGFSVKNITGLPRNGIYICLGSDWFSQEVWSFAKKHKDNKGRIVQIVYDLIPIVMPIYHKSFEKLAFTEWLDSALSYATDLVCISKHTASDLKSFSDNKGCSPNIKVLPLAHEFFGFERSEALHPDSGVEILLNQRYILSVGTIGHRKNNLMLLKAWRQLLSEIPGQLPLLVFAGKRGSGFVDVLDFLSDSDNEEVSRYVQIIQTPEDVELAWLYQNCLCTAYMSYYEGWGLPVGESAWFGKYCIASSASSVPEVCGDLMDYVEPDNLDDLTKVLKRAIVDKGYLADREARIKESPVRMWRDVADDLYGILRARPE